MPRTDFYVLNETNIDARYPYACRVIDKAYQRGHKVYVNCTDKTEAHLLDEMLWTFRDDSFIPHNLHGEGPTPPPPVQLGFDVEPDGFRDILINLSPEIPTYFTRFRRVIEVVTQDEKWKETSREHFRFYRTQGCQLKSHNIEL